MDRSVDNKKELADVPEIRDRARPCVWIKTGVINFRVCDHDGDCQNCPFDRAMRIFEAAQDPPKGKSRGPGWRDGMRKRYPGYNKPCRYFLNGSIGRPGMCRRNYDCEGCPVDMFFEYGSQSSVFLVSISRRRSQGYAKQSIQS